jgi:cephalosporin hydroxylase
VSRYDIDNYMPILKQMAKDSRGGFVLELGIGQADGSTKAFMEGLKERGEYGSERMMISVDFQIDFDLEQLNLNSPPWWIFIEGDTRNKDTVRQVVGVSCPRKPDIIFIDTEHSYEHMAEELEAWKDLADDNTVWLFHDTYMFGNYNKMTDAIKEFALREGWEYVDLDTGAHGLGMMRRGKAGGGRR